MSSRRAIRVFAALTAVAAFLLLPLYQPGSPAGEDEVAARGTIGHSGNQMAARGTIGHSGTKIAARATRDYSGSRIVAA